jgi:carotenoid cleavage dioxygenase-like enzyme
MASTALHTDHRLGFQSLENEVEVDELPIEGELPAWLTGTLVRTGPAKFDAGDRTVRHWFDGLAMLHKYGFRDGRIAYASRFLDSAAYRAVRDEGELRLREFATDPCRSIFKRVTAMFSPDFTDNGNVNVARLGERYIAMTETPLPIAFDAETLAAAGIAYRPPGQTATAHPHLDPDTGDLVNHATHYGPRSVYRFYAVPDAGPHEPRILAEIAAARPGYTHSFAISERHLVHTEQPYVVNPLKLATGGRPFIENFEWQPKRGTRFHVVDRRSGEVRGVFRTDAFFTFHHVNAFDDGDAVVVDLCAYDDPEIVDALFLDRVRGERPRTPVAELRRYRIDLAGGAVTMERLSDEPLELPRIDYRRRNGRPYRYVFGTGQRDPDGFLDQLVKVDLEWRETSTWHEPGTYPGEPVFVGRPGGDDEDDGVLLSVVLEPANGRSSLLVLDAADLAPLARAAAPHAIPFSFHGQFFR